MARGERKRFQAPLGTYLKLEYYSPEERSVLISGIIRQHRHESLRFPALDEEGIRRLTEKDEDKLEVLRVLLELKDTIITERYTAEQRPRLAEDLGSLDPSEIERYEEAVATLGASDGSGLDNRNHQLEVLRARRNDLEKRVRSLLDLLKIKESQREHADFYGVVRANLEGAKLGDGANNLDEADLRGALLNNASLENASLMDADLRGAELKNAVLRGANLSRAKLQGLTIEDFRASPRKKTRIREQEVVEEESRLDQELQDELIGALEGHLRDQRVAELKKYLDGTEKEISEELKTDLGGIFESHRSELQRRRLDGYLAEILKKAKDRVPDDEDHPTRPSTPTNGADLKGARLRGAWLEGTDLSHCEIEGIYFGGARLGKTSFKRDKIGKRIGEESEAFFRRLGSSRFKRRFARGRGYPEEAEAEHEKRRLLEEDEYLREELENLKKRDGEREEKLAWWVGEPLAKRLVNRRRKKRELALLYREAKEGYLTLKQNFADIGDYKASTWAYLKEREMERLESYYDRRYIKYVVDRFVGWVCGYGESIGRVLLALVLVFAAFTVLYWWTGLVKEDKASATQEFTGTLQSDEEFTGALKPDEDPSTFTKVNAGDYFLFSLGSMTTTKPDELKPQQPWVEFASRVEALLAIASIGLLGFVLGNRFRQR